MGQIDREHMDHPEKGVVSITDMLRGKGYAIGTRRVRKLMRLMGIDAIYPTKSLSKLGVAKYIRPYLLRSLEINRPNQVWSIDISYIPMKKGDSCI